MYNKLSKKLKSRIREFRLFISKKIWSWKSTQDFGKRVKLFLGICLVLVVSSKALYFSDFHLPNLELVIPTLVVVGAFAVHENSSKKWSKTVTYLGLMALASIFVIDTAIWGLRPIYLFTWPGLIGVWFIGKKKELSFMGNLSDITVEATLTTALLIIAYDIFTALGTWFFWGSLSASSLFGAYAAQVPFTLYHLGSLIFVPPLVASGKVLTNIKVKDTVTVKSKIEQKVKA